MGASLFYLFEGTRIDNFMALTVIVPLGVLTVYSLRHPPSIPAARAVFPVSSSAIHTYMLVPIGGGLVSIPKYLVAFFRASRLFRPVPPFRTSSRWEISDAVLAGYAPAGRCLFFTDADLSATSVQSLVRIVIYLKNISKRIPLN